MANYTKGADALSFLTTLREIDLDGARIPELGAAVFRARELTAAQRFDVIRAAAGADGSVNVALWRIMAATRGIIDPETGGPLFQGDAVGRLIESGNVIAERMGEYILDALSEATPAAVRSKSDEPSGTELSSPGDDQEDPESTDRRDAS